MTLIVVSGVVEAASAYETYLRNAATIQAGFRNGTAVRQALNVGAAYKPEQLEEGVIAYAALIALEDARFVRGVRETLRGREADALLTDPRGVEAIPGADSASGAYASGRMTVLRPSFECSLGGMVLVVPANSWFKSRV